MAVVLAESVKQAKVALDEGRVAFDLVLSDISMPVETGFDLLEWIKRPGSPHAGLPVLLTTAQVPEAENRLKGLAMGAVDYVVRPIELKELVLRSINAIQSFQRVRTLERSLQDSEGLAMVGRLLAASNHEIKNLVGLVSVSAEQTARYFGSACHDPDSQEAKALRSLRDSTALLADVARSMTSLLNPEVAAKTSFDLAHLTRGVCELTGPRLKPNLIDVRQDLSAPIWALGQPLRVKQVLLNLLLNAGDAIAELGPDEGGRITVSLSQDDTTCTLFVKDNGIGLPEAGERKEFPAFKTTKKLRGGQGLGLWLCSQLISVMGGRLTLASAGVGQGATARLTLPKTEAAPSDAEFDLDQYFID